MHAYMQGYNVATHWLVVFLFILFSLQRTILWILIARLRLQAGCWSNKGWKNWSKGIRDPRLENPRITVSWVGDFIEPSRVVIHSLDRIHGLDTWPLHPLCGVGTRSLVVVLQVGACFLVSGSHPCHVTLWQEDVVDDGIHDDNLGVFPPWPSEVSDLGLYCLHAGLTGEVACLEHEPAGAVHLGPSTCWNHALLVCEGLPHHQLAVLEHSHGVAEHEVDGAGDGAVAVELPLGLHVQGVLISVHLAVVEHCLVCGYPECNCLVLVGSCRVLESNAYRHEVIRVHTCTQSITTHHS